MRNIPEIRLKGFEGDWVKKIMESITKINSGCDYKELHEGPIPVYGTGGYMLSVDKALSYKKDAIGIGRKGTIDHPYILFAPFWTVDTLFYCIPKENFDINFLYDIFQNINWKSLDESTGVPSLSKVNINNIEVSIPYDIKEQQTIGTFFQNLDNLLTEQKNKLENLQKVKKSMLYKMFPREGQKVPEIRFKEFKGNWELITLGNVGLFHSNGVDKKVYPNEHMVNLLNYMDIYNCRVVNKRNCNSLMQVSANDRQLRDCNVLANDVFFTPSSETVEDVGHIMVIEEDLPNTCYSYHLMRFRPYKGVFYSSFPNYGFQTSFVRYQMRLMANGVQRFVLGKTEFESLQVLIPSYDEQKKIAKYFTSIDTQITFQTQRLKKLKQIKSACLQKMFI